jgi:endonuclease YncB( thermonuclease family)
MGNCQKHTLVHNIKKPNKPQPNDSIDEDHILSIATLDNTYSEIYTFNKAKVLSVYDGDTCTVAAFHRGEITQFRVRIFGIDAPEMRGGTVEAKEEAKNAQQYLSNLILNQIVLINVLDKSDSRVQRLDPFGRLLADIMVRYNDRMINVAEEMIKTGHAQPYFGGKKTKLHVDTSDKLH